VVGRSAGSRAHDMRTHVVTDPAARQLLTLPDR
jgi:hypothetical protein